MKKIIALISMLVAANTSAAPWDPPPSETAAAKTSVAPWDPPPSALGWSDLTTAAAMGYCLANHPYQTIHRGMFTPSGYEIVTFPGIVGAVRRNFVHDRSTLAIDESGGGSFSCKQACSEFGKHYGPLSLGVPLRQKLSEEVTINSGVGDMAALTMTDWDFALNKEVFAGIRSRGNAWHESDVAQADLCCCQVISAPD